MTNKEDNNMFDVIFNNYKNALQSEEFKKKIELIIDDCQQLEKDKWSIDFYIKSKWEENMPEPRYEIVIDSGVSQGIMLIFDSGYVLARHELQINMEQKFNALLYELINKLHEMGINSYFKDYGLLKEVIDNGQVNSEGKHLVSYVTIIIPSNKE